MPFTTETRASTPGDSSSAGSLGSTAGQTSGPAPESNVQRIDRYTYSAAHRLIICTVCKVSLHLGNFIRHAHYHHNTIKQEAIRIQAIMAQWSPNPYNNAAELKAGWAPSPPIRPVDGLAYYEHGLKCSREGCQFLCLSATSMHKHQKSHDSSWQASARGGDEAARQAASELQPWSSGVPCQRLIDQGPYNELFEVIPILAPTRDPASGLDVVMALGTQARQAQMAQIDQQASTVQLQDDKDSNIWLRKARWATFLQDCSKSDLQWHSRSPRRDEEPLAWAISQSVVRLAKLGQSLIRNRAAEPALFAVLREESEQKVDKPLKHYLETNITEACSPWRQILLVVMRAFTPEVERSMSHRPPLTLDWEQQALWYQVVEHASDWLADPANGNLDEDGGDSVAEGKILPPGGPLDTDHPELSCFDKAVLNFINSSLEQRAEPDAFACILVQALAIVAITAEGRFSTASQMTSRLSAIIKFARFWLIWTVYDEAIAAGHVNVGSRVEQKVQKYMLRTSGTSAEYLYSLRSYGMKIQHTSTSIGDTFIDGDLVIRGNIQFTLGALKSMLRSTIGAAEHLLQTDLAGSSTPVRLPEIPWNSLFDNVSNYDLMFNFVRDPRNRWPVDGDSWMLDRISRNQRLRNEWVSGNSWNPRRVRSWMGSVARFRELLLVLVHLTGGQPARGPELLTVQHFNNASDSHRGLFLEGGMVFFVTQYHKGFQSSQSLKVIHRYLPREVGTLVVHFLWLIMPFLRIHDVRTNDWMNGLLWPAADGFDRAWTPARISQVLEEVSGEHLGCSFGLRMWRHLCVGITHHHLPAKFHFSDDQAGNADSVEGNPMVRALDHQAAHSSYIGRLIYAPDGARPDAWRMASSREYREASVAWHELMGFTQPSGPHAISPNSRPLTGLPARSAQSLQCARLQGIQAHNLSLALRKMYDDDQLNFRPQQEESLRAIMSGFSPIISVLPTGGGKSLLFMLPAFLGPEGCSVVIVPLVSLRQDLAARCALMGLSCVEWRFDRQDSTAQIVLVTPETAVSETFVHYLNRLRVQGQLDRIFVDESHEVLFDHSSFRKHFEELHTLLFHRTQLIYLTATLPPTHLAHFQHRLGMTAVNRPRVYRAPTVRHNISYRLKVMQFECLEDEAIRIAKDHIHSQALKQLPEKMIIYGMTRPQVINLAESIGCNAYHSEASDRDRAFEDFRAGLPVPVIVATNALGLGVDLPDVTRIVHLGIPSSLIQYAQESGRAGRDGRRSCAQLLCASNWASSGMFGRLGADEQSVIREFMAPNRCRRVFLDSYLDGDEGGLVCCDGDEMCGWCLDTAGRMVDAWDWNEPSFVSDRNVADEHRAGLDFDDARPSESMQAASSPPSSSSSSSPSTSTPSPPFPLAPIPTSLPSTSLHVRSNPISSLPQSAGIPSTLDSQPMPGTLKRGRTQIVAGTGRDVVDVRNDLARQAARHSTQIERRRRELASRSAHIAPGSVRLAMREIEALLERWKGRCPVCEEGHSLRQCDSTEAEVSRADWILLKNCQPAAYTACFFCKCPQDICERWQRKGGQRETFVRVGSQCQFAGVISDCLSVWSKRDSEWRRRRLRARMEDANYSGGGGTTEELCTGWYRTTVTLESGQRVSRLVTEFCAEAQEVEEEKPRGDQDDELGGIGSETDCWEEAEESERKRQRVEEEWFDDPWDR